MDGYGWLKMGEMDGMVEIVPQFALSFGATYTQYRGKIKIMVGGCVNLN